MQVYAAYAACVAMNNILPANLGTIVMFVMLTTVIASATFAGMIGGFLVQKIFFTLAGTFVYLYLFLSRPRLVRHRLLLDQGAPVGDVAILVVAGVFVLVLVVRQLLAEGPRVVGAGEGGRPDPGAPRCLLRPRVPAGVRRLGREPLRRRDLPRRLRHPGHLPLGDDGGRQQLDLQHGLGHARRGGRQPGVQRRRAQATSPTRRRRPPTRSRSSSITTAWTILMALVLMIWVFGWGGGKTLVQQSYAEAKQKAPSREAKNDRPPKVGQPAQLVIETPGDQDASGAGCRRSGDSRAPARGLLLRRLPAGADDHAEAELAADAERDHGRRRAARDRALRGPVRPEARRRRHALRLVDGRDDRPLAGGEELLPAHLRRHRAGPLLGAHPHVRLARGRGRHEARRPPRRRR